MQIMCKEQKWFLINAKNEFDFLRELRNKKRLVCFLLTIPSKDTGGKINTYTTQCYKGTVNNATEEIFRISRIADSWSTGMKNKNDGFQRYAYFVWLYKDWSFDACHAYCT